jgi:hypothetical protein
VGPSAPPSNSFTSCFRAASRSICDRAESSPELLSGLGLLPAGGERDGVVDARLMVCRLGLDLGRQLGVSPVVPAAFASSSAARTLATGPASRLSGGTRASVCSARATSPLLR